MAGCGGREEGKIHCCLEVKANKRHGGDQELSLKIQHTGFVTFPLAETRAILERLTLAPGGEGMVGQEAAGHTEEVEREVER